MLSGEATNTNFIVFGLTRPGLEPTIYRIRGEHANDNATDVVPSWEISSMSTKIDVAGVNVEDVAYQELSPWR
jgi:hypothetical protein